MTGCVRAGCDGAALAPWWLLCAGCTAPLLEPATPSPLSAVDQLATAGWEAVDWAERIAPARWGTAVTTDPWVTEVRCVALAAVATGRSDACAHTTSGRAASPVVAVPAAVGVLRCPSCAEPVVARHSVTGAPCDRCRRVTVGPSDRVAAMTGTSLIIVAQLCADCAGSVLALSSFPTEA